MLFIIMVMLGCIMKYMVLFVQMASFEIMIALKRGNPKCLNPSYACSLANIFLLNTNTI